MTAPLRWACTWTAVVEALADLPDADLDRVLDRLTGCEIAAIADGFAAEEAAVTAALAIVNTADFADTHTETDDTDDRR
jgi:hypothetical protein